jgi:asparagine synthetase B (glutamine-hydrolysing)
VDNLEGKLLSAVTGATMRAARGARRVGVLASGGLDSSLLLSLAASLASRGQLPEPPLAIACEFAAPGWHDDRPYLRSLERHLGIDALRVTPADASHSIAQMFVVDAMPARPSDSVWAASCIGTMTRTRKTEVLLTGLGGDDLDGDPRLFGELARGGHLIQAVRGALRTRGVFYEGPARRLARFVLRPMMEPLMPRSLLRAARRWRNPPPAWAGHRLASRMRANAASLTPSASLGESPADRYERILSSNSLRSWTLTRPQEELVGGYALRAPFLDDEFLRFIATIPPLSLMQGGYLRGLMRAAMRDLVPEELRLRETKGTWFWFVQQAIMNAGGMDILRDLADTRVLASMGLVQPRPFLAFFDDFASSSREHADFSELWRVLSVEAFLRAHQQALGRAA